eukprot:scaffold161997_cov35-Attheya_sp.AAC.3
MTCISYPPAKKEETAPEPVFETVPTGTRRMNTVIHTNNQPYCCMYGTRSSVATLRRMLRIIRVLDTRASRGDTDCV